MCTQRHAHTYTHTCTHDWTSKNRNTLPLTGIGGEGAMPLSSHSAACKEEAHSPRLCCSWGTGGWLHTRTVRGGLLTWDPWTAASGPTSSVGTSCAQTTTCYQHQDQMGEESLVPEKETQDTSLRRLGYGDQYRTQESPKENVTLGSAVCSRTIPDQSEDKNQSSKTRITTT